MYRTKTDIDYENCAEELEDKSEMNVFGELKRRLNYELYQQEFDPDFDDTFLRENLKVFLISCKPGYENKFEMQRLIKEIFSSLPDELDCDDNGENKSNLFLNLSRNEINNIRKKLEKRVVKLSALSAASDIVPIAGQLADLGIF